MVKKENETKQPIGVVFGVDYREKASGHIYHARDVAVPGDGDAMEDRIVTYYAPGGAPIFFWLPLREFLTRFEMMAPRERVKK